MTHFFKIYYITLIIILLGTDLIYSQESYANNCQFVRKEHSNIQVHFRFDTYILEPQYMGNSASLQKLTHIIDSIGVLYGTDGPEELKSATYIAKDVEELKNILL